MFVEPTTHSGLLYLPSKLDGNLTVALVQVTCLTISVTLDAERCWAFECLIPCVG